MRAAVASPPLPLPPTAPRTDIPEAEMPPRKRACLTTPAPGYEIGESSAAGAARQPGPTPAVDTWDQIVEAMMEIAPTTLEGVDQRVTELDTTVRQFDEELSMDCYEERSPHTRHMLGDTGGTGWHIELLRPQTAESVELQTLRRHPFMIIDVVGCMNVGFIYVSVDFTYHVKMFPTRSSHEDKQLPPQPRLPTQSLRLTPSLNDQGVAGALAERDASRSRDGDNSHGSGTGGRRQVPTQRECTYTDFLKCQPINFKGTEGVVKFASCTLQGSALTWWNSHVRAVGQDVAYTMPWTALKRMITDKYCPRGEIKKLESEYWNLKFPEESAKWKVDHCIKNWTTPLPENKRKLEENLSRKHPKPNKNHSKETKWQRAYTAGPGDKKLMEKPNLYVQSAKITPRWACTLKCSNLQKDWSSDRDLSYQGDCPKLKNGNQGNRAGNGNAVARAYVVGSAGTNPNSNVVKGTFLLNNRYAFITFDTGAIEGVDSKVSKSPRHRLMPVEMGSFDVIIGMDWLAKYHAVIVCDEKLVRVPFGDKTLIFHGDGSSNGHESRLNIISCTKAQKYLLEGCPIFLAHVTMKKTEDKSKEKQLEEVPIVQRPFPKVIPEELCGYSRNQPSGFSNSIDTGAAPVARALIDGPKPR
ncbi:putative reverse transcriptase domain-containing protein [Tanacetum coccineum]